MRSNSCYRDKLDFPLSLALSFVFSPLLTSCRYTSVYVDFSSGLFLLLYYFPMKTSASISFIVEFQTKLFIYRSSFKNVVWYDTQNIFSLHYSSLNLQISTSSNVFVISINSYDYSLSSTCPWRCLIFLDVPSSNEDFSM